MDFWSESAKPFAWNGYRSTTSSRTLRTTRINRTGGCCRTLDTDHLAIAYYALGPGERFSGSVHAHADQEEVFVALALGAPRDTGDIRIDQIPVLGGRDVSCPGCDRDSMRIPTDGRSGLVCPACDADLEVE